MTEKSKKHKKHTLYKSGVEMFLFCSFFVPNPQIYADSFALLELRFTVFCYFLLNTRFWGGKCQ